MHNGVSVSSASRVPPVRRSTGEPAEAHVRLYSLSRIVSSKHWLFEMVKREI